MTPAGADTGPPVEDAQPTLCANGELGLYVAARVEQLLDPLVARLRDPERQPDPFAPITIMVQSRGMQRWLSHQLAERLDPAGRGIATNLDFPFPGKVVATIVAACLGQPPDHVDPWARERLVWPILAELRAHAPDPAFQRLTRYLGGRTALDDAVVDRRAWRFGDNVADVFDRYALHRPTMVRRWAAGDDVDPEGSPLDERDVWQPRLWRALVARHGDPTQRLEQAITALEDGTAALDTAQLFDPLLTFGISGLPPRQLDLIAALATSSEVELYVPTASTARWERLADAAGTPRPEPRHPLLISCGSLLDDAAELLLAKAHPHVLEPDAAASEQSEGSLLRRLQSTIQRDAVPDPASDLAVVDGQAVDRSVQIHACHGPARQAEVLRDVLLGLLAEDPVLEPRDILVMTPDIDAYAPLIQAAFTGTPDVPELPVTVADRQVARTNPVADALLAALDLGTGRVAASQVLDLLGRDVVQRRFGLDLADLTTVAGWVQATGIRWGIDADHRARHGQPADRAHTWRFGLDRLLLGAAMADEGHRVIGDVAPFDDIEGNDVEVAGRVAQACTTLFRFVALSQDPTDLDGWVQRCVDLLGDLVAVPPNEGWRLQEVRAALEARRDEGGSAADAEPLLLDLAAARAVIEGCVAQPRGAAGYETGAVTLCALVPMRSIPHKVVALLGMDDGALPRSAVRLGFDLQDRFPQRGDRDRRREDRSLFLEAVLSARDHLVVTTSAHDVRTGEERPPAVPLAELLDVLDASATVADGTSVRQAITRDHPLQPFSPRNFGDDGNGGTLPPFGFDPVAKDAAERVRHPQRVATAFLASPLPPPQPDPDDVEAVDPALVRLDDLTDALLHPTRFLLVRRLGIGLREHTVELDDLEPVELHPLVRSQLGRDLLRSAEGLADPDAWRVATLATGTAPAGTPGQVRLADVGDDVATLVATAAARVGVADDPGARAAIAEGGRQDLDMAVGDRRIVGEVGGLYQTSSGPVRLSLAYARPRPEQLLRAWVSHLALTAAGHVAIDTWIVTRGTGKQPQERHLGPLAADPDEARSHATSLLSELIAVHDRAWCEPLPLFPKASAAFAEKGDLRVASMAFVPNPFLDGDVGDRDEATVHVYGQDVTLDDLLAPDGMAEEFEHLAGLVWGRALAHEAESGT